MPEARQYRDWPHSLRRRGYPGSHWSTLHSGIRGICLVSCRSMLLGAWALYLLVVYQAHVDGPPAPRHLADTLSGLNQQVQIIDTLHWCFLAGPLVIPKGRVCTDVMDLNEFLTNWTSGSFGVGGTSPLSTFLQRAHGQDPTAMCALHGPPQVRCKSKLGCQVPSRFSLSPRFVTSWIAMPIHPPS